LDDALWVVVRLQQERRDGAAGATRILNWRIEITAMRADGSIDPAIA